MSTEVPASFRSAVDHFVKYTRLSPGVDGTGEVKSIAINVESDPVFVTIWGPRFGSAHIQLEPTGPNGDYSATVNMSGFCGDRSPDAIRDYCDYAQRIANLASFLAKRLTIEAASELHSPSV